MYEGNHNKIVQLIDRNTCLILNKIEDRFVTVKKLKTYGTIIVNEFKL